MSSYAYQKFHLGASGVQTSDWGACPPLTPFRTAHSGMGDRFGASVQLRYVTSS